MKRLSQSMPVNMSAAPSRAVARAGPFVLLLAAQMVAVTIGLRWAAADGAASPVWPAAGVALGGLLLGGWRLWPAVFLGAGLAMLMTGDGWARWTTPLLAAANAVGALLGVTLLKRLGFDARLERLPDLLLLIAAGAVGAAASATIGVSTLVADGLPLGMVPTVGAHWWVGDAIGALTLAPLLLAWASGGVRPVAHLGMPRLGVVILFVGLFATFLMLRPDWSTLRYWHGLPLLVWAAVAFQLRGATLALLALTVIATWATTEGLGPFAHGATDPALRHLMLQQFLGVVGGTVLVLGVVVGERGMERRLREAQARHEQERNALLERERAARVEAEAAGRRKDEFLATLSHELRAPLAAILGWTKLIARGSVDPGLLAQGLAVIERNVRGQAQMVDDLLDVSRIAAGKLRLELRPMSPTQAVEAALAIVRPAAQAKGVALEAALDPALVVRGDLDRLQQVVWNLLANAIKFTPAGGCVRVAVRRGTDGVELEVADDGEGIAPEFLPHVFERFRQADGTNTRIHGGLGLGLAIVAQLVELHGGSVRAHSDGPGRGARFVVRLPLSA
mgnify:CR=1 FL=1